MTFFSNEIKGFLDKIYFYELSHWNGDGEMAPVHDFFESRLSGVDDLSHHSLSSRFPFNRDKLFVLVVGRFIFGYRFDGTIAVVEIYRKLEAMNDWLDAIIPESKQKVSLVINEKYVRKIVRNCIQRILNETYSTSRVGKYIVVLGDNQPHSIEGLEKYRDNLYDVAMYNSKEEHICVFSIGRNTKKFICCNLEYDKDYGEWLGFTPIKSYDVPTLIRQDLRERFTNS